MLSKVFNGVVADRSVCLGSRSRNRGCETLRRIMTEANWSSLHEPAIHLRPGTLLTHSEQTDGWMITDSNTIEY